MATPIADQCLLVKLFAEFDLLPNLLAIAEDMRAEAAGETLDPDLLGPLDEAEVVRRWGEYLDETGANMDHIEEFDYTFRHASYLHFARDVMGLAHRLDWVLAPTIESKALSDIGRRPWEERSRDTEVTIKQALQASVGQNYLGRNGEQVISLVQSAAWRLSNSSDAWAQVVPGLLLIEFWALIYWSFRRPWHAGRLLDLLVANRNRAIHVHGGSVPGPDANENQTFLADATGNLYLEDARLAARTGLNITGAAARPCC